MKRLLTLAVGMAVLIPSYALASGGHQGHDMSSMKMGGMKMDYSKMKMAKKQKMAMGVGKINSINYIKRTVNISHQPIKSLHWPAMTMDLNVSDNVNLKDLKVNNNVKFHIILGEDRVFRITKFMDVNSKDHQAMENKNDEHGSHKHQ